MTRPTVIEQRVGFLLRLAHQRATANLSQAIAFERAASMISSKCSRGTTWSDWNARVVIRPATTSISAS